MADVTIGVIKYRGMGTETNACNGSKGDTKKSPFGALITFEMVLPKDSLSVIGHSYIDKSVWPQRKWDTFDV